MSDENKVTKMTVYTKIEHVDRAHLTEDELKSIDGGFSLSGVWDDVKSAASDVGQAVENHPWETVGFAAASVLTAGAVDGVAAGAALSDATVGAMANAAGITTGQVAAGVAANAATAGAGAMMVGTGAAVGEDKVS